MAAFLYNDFDELQAVLQYSLVIPTMTFLGALATMCISCAWDVSQHTDMAEVAAKAELGEEFADLSFFAPGNLADEQDPESDYRLSHALVLLKQVW